MNERILSCPIPSNINPLSPNGYLLTIQKLPEISFFAQTVALPQLSLSPAEVNSPFVQIPTPGDIADFSPLSVQFLVDDQMSNYKALYSWITGLAFPDSNQQYTDFVNTDALSVSDYKKMVSDATLIILGNHNNPIQTVQFYDCWPESIGSLSFTSNVQDVQYLVGDVSFRYSHYKFL